ncbi:hypothetical protein J2738_001801 [Variovorax paradoxus]|uniref:TonB C-terminal domain-containing protein n=1 Tax=Variovorax paradoxus TaxID=34073 RepID=A0AAE4BX79_VARPD|nr:hypothetical protein [Variovorax paradoxus]MDR6425672.1 hypothetical protein [Variovorax paradoxus]
MTGPLGRMLGARPMLLCAALSVSLHAAVLAYRVAPSSPMSTKAAARGDDGRTASGATQIRVIPKRPADVSGIKGTAKQRQEQPQVARSAALSSPVAGAAVMAAPARPDAPAPGTPPQPAIDQGALDTMAEVRSQAVETVSSDREDFDGSDYIPRSLLTVPPSALTAIVLDMPEGEFAPERYAGVLSLFIDAEGHVKHVAAEGALLPPAFEQVARQAFSAAFFSPGQMDGRAVKSRQKVEVVFDNTLTGKDSR